MKRLTALRLPALRLPSLPSAPRLGLIPKVVAALAVVALVAGAYAFWPRQDNIHVTGEFSRAVGLFPGSDVRILGVAVGTVTEVTPRGNKVEVKFEFDRKYKVPADAKAAVVAPSLVSDRYVQLLPAYTAGPVMKDDAQIGLDRTAVPVELDRISSSLDDLLVALGPTGANKDGAFADLLDTGAKNLGGQGQKLHDTNRDLSLALDTLSGGRNDLFGTVKNLQTFTTMLATNDSQVRRLNGHLASVSGPARRGARRPRGRPEEPRSRLERGAARSSMTTAPASPRTSSSFAPVTGTVAKQRDALAETLTNAPVAVSNLQNAYNPDTGTLDTRANINENLSLQNLLCSFIVEGGQPASLCKTVSGALKPISDLLDQLDGLGVKLPLDILSALPQSQTATSATSSASTTAADQGATVRMRGADPTLGGLLGGSR